MAVENMTIGERLTYRREQLGRSQRQVMTAAKITRTSYQNYENDIRVPRADRLNDIAKVLKVDIGWFFTQ
jgi:transcriptional regulator with XRE-family HTH domain